jgi:hypothetical protein
MLGPLSRRQTPNPKHRKRTIAMRNGNGCHVGKMAKTLGWAFAVARPKTVFSFCLIGAYFVFYNSIRHF